MKEFATVAEIADEIRSRLAARRAESAANDAIAGGTPTKTQNVVRIAEVVAADDRTFVDNLYNKVLGRPAKSEEISSALFHLHSVTRTEFAAELQRSTEAQERGTVIYDLLCPAEQVQYLPPEVPPLVPPIDHERMVYRLSDLLGFEGAPYIIHLYRSLAKCQPADVALRRHLQALEQERRTPLEILLEVACSPEAHDAGTIVLGIDDMIRRSRMRSAPPSAPSVDPRKLDYTVGELLAVPQSFFVTHLYRCLLKRDPDPAGAAGYSVRWLSGDLSVDIIQDISRSPEARGKGVRITGLWATALRRRLSALPLVGRLIAIAANLVYLPELVRQFRTLQLRPLPDYTSSMERSIESLRAEVSALTARSSQAPPAAAPNEADIAALWASLEEKVGRDELDELLGDKVTRRELAQALEHKASLDQLTRLDQSKADRTEISGAMLEQTLRIDDVEQRQAEHHLQTHEMLLAQTQRVDAIDQQRVEQTLRIDDVEQRQAEYHQQTHEMLLAQTQRVDAIDQQRVEQTLRIDDVEQRQAEYHQQTHEMLRAQTQRVDTIDQQRVEQTLRINDVEQRQAEYHQQTHEMLLAQTQRVDTIEQQRVEQTLRIDDVEQRQAEHNQQTHEMLLAQTRRIDTIEQDRQSDIQQTHDKLLEQTRRIDGVVQCEERKAEASSVTQLAASSNSMHQSFGDALTNLTDRQQEALAAIRALKLRILDIERRLALVLEEARKRLPAPMEELQISTIAAHLDGLQASQYTDFEDVFRGTREDIKNRQAVYLPYFERVPRRGARFPILDIGCGRGEFLEILRENGHEATGVDANPNMVERCRELGLQVEHTDALDYLRGAKSGQYAVITSFHVVEHIPHPRLLTLLDEALRVLRPGGLLILETPNPQNLVVGASSFYLDPTHLNPIPPAQLRFVVEARGFVNAEVKPMHPVPDYARPSGVEIPGYLADLLYGPQDYAVVAWKA